MTYGLIASDKYGYLSSAVNYIPYMLFHKLHDLHTSFARYHEGGYTLARDQSHTNSQCGTAQVAWILGSNASLS
jgi:hypothetical protein